MADRADFSGSKSPGAKGSTSRNGSGLARTAKSPSPRPKKNSGEKRPRGPGGTTSPSDSQNNKKSKANQSWGSRNSTSSAVPSSISSSKNSKQPAINEKPASEPKKTGYRILKHNINVEIDTPQGIKAKSDAAKARASELAKTVPPTPKPERAKPKRADETTNADFTGNNNDQTSDMGKQQSDASLEDRTAGPEGRQPRDDESIASNESKSFSNKRNIVEESRGFAVTIDQKDRARAKFLDAKMFIQGIAARLGLGPDALADTRGFAIRGDPKMGRIFVSIPQHFEERLNGVIQESGGGFVFRTLFPKETEVADRSPVLMHVKRASTTAVRNATMAPKKNKDLWFSFVVGLDFQGIQQEARAALRTALEACGFKVTKMPVMCFVKGTRIYNNMVHVEFSDYPKDVADHAWHEWAVGAKGFSIMCNGITLNVNLHNMDPTFMRNALKVKPVCFHNIDKVCICKQSSGNGRGGNRHRPTSEERRAAKQAEQDADLELLKQLAELNSATATAGEEF